MVKTGTIEQMYAFASRNSEPCDYCIETVRKWNLPLCDGETFDCTGCGNRMLMKHVKGKIDNYSTYNLTKNYDDFEDNEYEIVPKSMELNSLVYVSDDFENIRKKYDLGDDWTELDSDDDIIRFEKANCGRNTNDVLHTYYGPFNGGVLTVNCYPPEEA